ncbi:MAG: glycosyltransferase [Candidatus Eremiobacteraeota bacterium]|nr:glycosyltransferase [Candidatus Eremiobacteraeota bacterium]
MHLVEASGGNEYMFGKEKVIHWLMREQHDSGKIRPMLATFSPCQLASVVKADNFPVSVLQDHHQTIPLRSLAALLKLVRRENSPVLHTHGYKANIVGRVARCLGARIAGIVSTCHGFIDETPALRLYNTVDRLSGIGSSVVTAPDGRMLDKFPRYVRTAFVPNAIPDRALPTKDQRKAARASFGWSPDLFVAGMLGRFSAEKGIANFIGAARRTTGAGTIWAAAGAGTMEQDISGSGRANLQVVGYVSPSDDYLSALDVYVQPSFTEGLSLSLLEAMRAGLAIVATDVGATDKAVRHEHEALLITPDPIELERAVARLQNDPDLAKRLGSAARRRFEELFRIEVLAKTFYGFYREAVA